mmetsp:Transcript_30818/g.49390  ORF Transcript_30818/g.49390 Transcript_30818/m.49390 type:complete len:116 (-) Transcript_30818:5908-6255(-)
MSTAKGVDDEESSRLGLLLSLNTDCSPTREIRWWVQKYGEQEGFQRVMQGLLHGMNKHISRVCEETDTQFNEQAAYEFLERICTWFEHVVCAPHLLKLDENPSWAESSEICAKKN